VVSWSAIELCAKIAYLFFTKTIFLKAGISAAIARGNVTAEDAIEQDL